MTPASDMAAFSEITAATFSDSSSRSRSVTGQPASVNADRLQLVAPGVCDRRFAAVGQHDRCAVGRVQRKQLQSRRDLRRLREQSRDVLGTDLLYIRDMALAQG